jgi:glycosyltransferase involved in cell wall biosynthesis
MKLSIIIPSRNEENYISGVLGSIYESDIPFDFEVIIADNSTDSTRDIINYNYPTVKIIQGGTVSQGRNNGVKVASGEYLIFMDADISFVDEDLINKAVNHMEDGSDMVTTRLSCDNDVIADMIYGVCNLIQLGSKIEGKPFSTGCFMGVKKSIFETLGGFDESLHFAEDYHLSRKVKPNKFKIIRNSTIYTDNRRFKKIGYFGLMRQFGRIALSRYNKNDESFKKDIGYWL